jgi:hypothetical protein
LLPLLFLSPFLLIPPFLLVPLWCRRSSLPGAPW